MAIVRIAKNVSLSPVVLSDLGDLTIPVGEQVDLLQMDFTLEALSNSTTLTSAINAGTIVLNDGTGDLSPTDALNSTKPASFKESGSAPVDFSALQNTGVDAWSGTGAYYSIALPNFTLLRGGTGYIKGTKVTWAGSQSVVLTANKTTYIYIDSSGTIGKVTHDVLTEESYFYNYIILFEVLYDGTVTEVVREDHQYSINTRTSRLFHNSVGILIRGTGAIATRVTTGTGGVATDRQIKTVGADVVDDHGLETIIPETNPVTWDIFYKNASNQWIRYSQAATLPMFYNNAGTPTALGSGAYGRFGLYVSKDDLNSSTPKFIAIMGDATYASFDLVVRAIALGQVALAIDELSHLELAQIGHAVVLNNVSGGYIVDIILQKATLPTKALGSIQAVLPTLGQAYRALGSTGAGRIVTIDQGPIELNAGATGYAPLQLTPLAAAPTLTLAAGQRYIGTNGIEYLYDSTRTKWLSVQKFYPQWAGPGALDNQVLPFGNMSDVSSGPRMFRNATIIGTTVKVGSGATNKQFEVYKNGGPGVGTLITTLTLAGLVLTDNTLNIDLAANDFLVVWVASAGLGISYVVLLLEIAWRP